MFAVIMLRPVVMVLLLFPWGTIIVSVLLLLLYPCVFVALSFWKGTWWNTRVYMDLRKQRCVAPFHFKTEAFFFGKTR